VVGSGGGI